MALVDPKKCEDFITLLIERLGAGTSGARRWAEIQVETSLLGIDSHGIRMLDRYVRHINGGGIDPAAAPVIISEDGSCVRLNANACLGHLAADRAARQAVEKAKAHGISCITVNNCNHVGALAVYAKSMAEQDCIAILSAVSRPGMAPWGGSQNMIGLNPLAIATPSGKGFPFLLDISTTVTAMGKVIRARDEGRRIPEGWALDATGSSTTDPDAAFHGSLLPIGGHKGYGLGMAIELITVLLGGGAFATEVNSWISQTRKPMGVSCLVIGIDAARFGNLAHSKGRIAAWMDALTASPRREGFTRIRYPGQRAGETYRKRRAEGIPADEHTLSSYRELSQKFGIPW